MAITTRKSRAERKPVEAPKPKKVRVRSLQEPRVKTLEALPLLTIVTRQPATVVEVDVKQIEQQAMEAVVVPEGSSSNRLHHTSTVVRINCGCHGQTRERPFASIEEAVEHSQKTGHVLDGYITVGPVEKVSEGRQV